MKHAKTILTCVHICICHEFAPHHLENSITRSGCSLMSKSTMFCLTGRSGAVCPDGLLQSGAVGPEWFATVGFQWWAGLPSNACGVNQPCRAMIQLLLCFEAYSVCGWSNEHTIEVFHFFVLLLQSNLELHFLFRFHSISFYLLPMFLGKRSTYFSTLA